MRATLSIPWLVFAQYCRLPLVAGQRMAEHTDQRRTTWTESWHRSLGAGDDHTESTKSSKRLMGKSHEEYDDSYDAYDDDDVGKGKGGKKGKKGKGVMGGNGKGGKGKGKGEKDGKGGKGKGEKDGKGGKGGKGKGGKGKGGKKGKLKKKGKVRENVGKRPSDRAQTSPTSPPRNSDAIQGETTSSPTSVATLDEATPVPSAVDVVPSGDETTLVPSEDEATAKPSEDEATPIPSEATPVPSEDVVPPTSEDDGATSSPTASSSEMDTVEPSPPIADADFPTVFRLGNIRPEGIAACDDNILYICNLAYGGVRRLDVSTNSLSTIVPNQAYWERGAVGIVYTLGVLVVTGGGSVYGWRGAMYVYDAETGIELASCVPSGDPARFLNGVAVIGDVAYATDSQRNVLMRLDINAAINGECIVGSIPLVVDGGDADPFSTNDPAVFLANGIVGYADGLIVNSASGLYYHNLLTDETMAVPSSDETSGGGGDGLLLDGNRLYVTHATLNQIRVYDVGVDEDGETVQAIYIGFFTSPRLDSPTSTAQLGGLLYTTNARWKSLAFPAPNEGNRTLFEEQFTVVVTDPSTSLVLSPLE